jgi:transposase
LEQRIGRAQRQGNPWHTSRRRRARPDHHPACSSRTAAQHGDPLGDPPHVWAPGVTPHHQRSDGIERDKAAVVAALMQPWSNGQVEGQVNRLKLIKRSMYGRANFDLLRQRVLAA